MSKRQRKKEAVVRYVIRYRDDAMQPAGTYDRERSVWSKYFPHPHRGQYVMDGGHITADIQDAKIFRARAEFGRAFHSSVHELIPVAIAPLAGVALRAWEAARNAGGA